MRWRGRVARRMIVMTHLQAIAFVMFVLLTVAIAIDLTETLDEVRAHVAETGQSLPLVLAQYLSYRAADIVTRLLPMACLAGAFVAELLRHQRMENVILAAAGAGPGLFLASMLWVGLVVGGTQVALEGWLRPAAVFAQTDLGIGSYAHRFRRGESGPRWFLDGNRAMRARVLRDKNPELRDVMIFEGIDRRALSSVTHAARATPGAKDQEWILEDVVIWTPSGGQVLFPQRHDTLMLQFPLREAHLEYHDIWSFYLPNAALRQIATLEGTPQTADGQTAVARRFLAVFLPGVFALLGASLAQAARSGRLIAWWRLLALGTLGYITLVSVKAFWSLGEMGAMAPLPATTAPLFFALTLVLILQVWLNGLPSRR